MADNLNRCDIFKLVHPMPHRFLLYW